MVNMNQFTRGMCLSIDGKNWKIVEFQHVNPGNWRAFVRTKLKDLSSGNVVERTFRDRDDFPEISLDARDMELLYHDADGWHFMDQENYEQVTLSTEDLGEFAEYIKDHDKVKVLILGGKPMGVELPAAVTLKVVYTEPAVKGDTATGASKDAKLETGLVVKVPLFVKEGETIKVDTRTGDFLGRA